MYKNGEVILPPKLLHELQKYIQGEIIYIPKKDKKRAGWGELNGTKFLILKRNTEIFNKYEKGHTTKDLAASYHLSEDSIKKIVRSFKSKDRMYQIS
ncbi:CD3324 family protein [Acetivibrio cellulolyticus]|uniref:CD3324 family protein n=1 Tax=Acetivibrio cellulolyticus TaxID=35830 RepID=UPI0001E2FB1B|nr:CD3324 family protein [Acetivibrio cellulolyticus]